MSLLTKIADRLILCPSTTPIDPGENRRELVMNDNDVEIEAWVDEYGEFAETEASRRLIVLKIGGTGGRAERASVHPAELIVGDNDSARFAAAQVWTLNHRGYGGSTGPASIKNFVATLESFWTHVTGLYPSETKLVTGNSLGCISALYFARRKEVAALLLRNPPPIHQLISTRPKYNWWSFGAAKMIAKQVPEELDAIANAGQALCPSLFVTSEKDSVVPVNYQQRILDAFAGESRQFIIKGAEHHHLVSESQQQEYVESINWLKQKLVDQTDAA